MEGSTSMFDKEKAEERLAKLSGGVAVIQVCSMNPNFLRNFQLPVCFFFFNLN